MEKLLQRRITPDAFLLFEDSEGPRGKSNTSSILATATPICMP
uniref:Uncharacterized protein n=1 Tax=Nelumbo nucifera TaxID=4432 RepID=A0A822YWU7_NELNU|nr:TPA_asm: hypothetical protein HUJ06_006265 [Nelumbo nucifera]